MRPHDVLLAIPIAIVVAIATAAPATAQVARDGSPPPDTLTTHTVRFDPERGPGRAILADAAWLIGRWDGAGFGGTVQEMWGPPAAGRMTGAFTSLVDGQVRFHELMALVETNGTLEIWVRHFDPDFTAWEEKDDKVVFRLVDAAPGRLRFGGLTLERTGEGRARFYLAMRRGGELHEAVFEMVGEANVRRP